MNIINNAYAQTASPADGGMSMIIKNKTTIISMLIPPSAGPADCA